MRSTVIAAALIATGITSAAVYTSRGEQAPELVTALVARGDIVQTVAATGTLEAVTTVHVGSQLSGTVQALYADFNSMVRKGEVLARLDPSFYATEIEQARANLIRAQAEVERLAIVLDDAKVKLARARELSDKLLLAAVDLEAASVQVRSAEAQKKSAEAQVVQAQASLTQAEVNLEKTVITAPIDGVVVARSVDVGQTVAASLQAPTLYVIAADLTKMRVNASIDESDVGTVRSGQRVRFRVDAYPGEEFFGTVAQVRLSPIILQNVVTYAGVIDVPNPELKLKPGMTATVDVEIGRRDDVLRVPNVALRFDPSPATLSALGLDASIWNRTAKRSDVQQRNTHRGHER
jgi:HlyD family secretion protein